MMVTVDPKLYRKYVMTDHNGQSILCVKIHKALYGLLMIMLLFYKKFVTDLEQYSPVLNPYDPFVANKKIDGHEMTVTWHIDDFKVSHKDQFEVAKFACYLQ